MDSDSGCLIFIFLTVTVFLLNFCINAFESALQSITDTGLQNCFDAIGRSSDTLMHLKDHPDELRYTSRLIGMFGSVLIAGSAYFMVSFSLIQILLLILAFYLVAVSIPDILGRKHTGQWFLKRYGPVHGILVLCRPVSLPLTIASGLIIRIFGVDPATPEPEVTEDEIISMVNEGHEQGVLNAQEAEMIQNIFEMDDKNAEDIMTHRKNIIGINAKTSLLDAITFMAGESVSRFPIYEEDIDNIIGILHFKDAMKFHMMEQYDERLICEIPGLLREVHYIPETRGIHLLFRSMQAEKQQLVIVVDEYGQTAGLVAMEDILEEIVGNIQDEYDNETPHIRRLASGAYLMDGMAPLDEAKEILGITQEEEEYDTLNGLLISKLDRIPADGEQAEVITYGYLFQIRKVENKMIRLVKITKYKEEE